MKIDARPLVAPEIAAAIEAGRPVVALESTILSHGLPWPRSRDLARDAERAIREEGAVPATVALIDGRPRVGLGAAELERLCRGAGVLKVASRELGACVAAGATGGTTVSATMRLAHLAGIEVFATGGIGGVHRGAEATADVSSDLTELAATPVLVVCAGAKSILDIPRTLELLETLRVPVAVLGADDFPAFHARSCGLPAPWRLEGAREVAAAWGAHLALSGARPTGMLIANPIPEADAMPRAEIEGVVGAALAEAAAQGVTGKAVTPFLLDRLYRLTEGRSLEANVALMLANARLAARIAVAGAG
jgi:pseudouridine-5'-phosphate glycosidase